MSLRIASVARAQDWEKFLGEVCPAALFQSWTWGEVAEKLGQKVWRFGFWQNQNLVGIAQIIKVVARRGIFLHVRHGPVFYKQRNDYWQEFFSFARNLAQKEGAWFVRVSPLIVDTPAPRQLFHSLGLLPAAIHAMDAERCWVLDLDHEPAQLLANMRKSTRYEIRQAQKLGVAVVKSTNPSDLPAFLDLYAATARRQDFIPHQGIREEFESFTKKNQALLIFLKYQGKLLAGALILFYGGQAIYHHGASVPSEIPASYLVQWEAIGEAQKRGLPLYNFWGIAPAGKPRHPWAGITLFKKGFGGREVIYLHAHDLPISPGFWLVRGVELWRRWQKGY
ncbi:MAG: lipid II:glycine glycyltransferase FemX [Patescibacteria group bacterium]